MACPPSLSPKRYSRPRSRLSLRRGGRARADSRPISSPHPLLFYARGMPCFRSNPPASPEGEADGGQVAGGGVVSDTCLAFHRKCWSFDLDDRPETRPEIEPYQWNPENLLWPVPPKGLRAGKGKEKPDLIFFDPPYFNKLAAQYGKESISSLSRKEYLRFFQELFPLIKERSRSSARIAFLNADWRAFQGVSALKEDAAQGIRIDDYIDLLKHSGWEITHIIDCPMSLRAVSSTSRRPHNASRQMW